MTNELGGWVFERRGKRILKRIGVRAIDDDIFSWGNRPGFWSNGADEPIIPTFESPMRFFSINIVVIPVDIFLGSLTHPAEWFLSINIFE